MLLTQLLEPLPKKQVCGSLNLDISSIAYDSRSVKLGTLFACIKGDKFDGHEFIDQAISHGATAILVDGPEHICRCPDGAGVLVPSTRSALPIIANRFFDYPSRKLKMIGVTGTKGKTTTTYLVESVLAAGHLRPGVIGTLGARFGMVTLPPDRTTPESVDLQELLSRMVDDGVSAVSMEVSSHALVKERTEGCEYDVGVFTNLTHDHLDFHHTLEEYLEAKLILFREYPLKSEKRFTAVINIDDPYGQRVVEESRGEKLSFRDG